MERRWRPLIEQHIYKGLLDRTSTGTDLAAIARIVLELSARARLSA